VRLHGGASLDLPLRALPGDRAAIALLMSNQTGFAIERALGALLAALARDLGVERIVGIPTMGLEYARATAEALGHDGYTALGFSRKFWFDDALSEPAASITSGAGKRMYLDPGLRDEVRGRRVVLVDDVISTGGTVAAAVRLMQRAGAEVAGVVVGLTEGHAWRETLAAFGDAWADHRVRATGHLPIFEAVPGGWAPIPDTVERTR
jgi:adenine/guanine phosphoribosyltransferase-like PRPP-binding protein